MALLSLLLFVGSFLTQTLDSLCNDDALATSQIGLMVYDLDVDTLVYEFNSQQLMRPASTMKILTAITALDVLPTDYQLKTTLSSANNNIYIRGSLDPTLGPNDLDKLVGGLIAAGIDTIYGKLVADKSLKDTLLWGEGWCWDDNNPTLSPLVYKNEDRLLELLRQRIQKTGIVVLGGDSLGVTPSGALELATIYTPLNTVLQPMMKDSNNLCAESVFYQIGQSMFGRYLSAKDIQGQEKAVLRRAGLEPDRYRLADGSGLSLYNYLSAECEVMLLRYAYHNSKIYNRLYKSLPTAAVDGTLKKRMKNTSAAGKVHAKTGSVTAVFSLAGYCQAKSGHTLAFCIINQGILQSSIARGFQDKVCIALCE